MARINSYPTLTNPTTNDLLVATDVSETGNPTKSLSIADLSSLIAPAAGGATSLNGLSDVLIDGTSAYFITIPGNLVGNPGGNVTLGFNAGSALTTGSSNSLYGNAAGDALTTGINNSAFGDNALGAMNTGNYSVAIGDSALLKLTGANNYNTAVGYEAGFQLLSGSNNTLIGHDAGYGGAFASYSGLVAVGDEAAKSITSAGNTVAVGRRAANSITTQGDSTMIGFDAGRYSFGTKNTYVGSVSGTSGAPASNNTGSSNVAIGYCSGGAITTGSGNVFLGNEAGCNFTTGSSNIYIGNTAGANTNTGDGNIFMGVGAAENFSGTNDNIGIGRNVLANYTTASNRPNIAIGKNVGTLLNNADGGNTMLGHLVMSAATTAYKNTILGNESGKAILTAHSNVAMGWSSLIALTSGTQNLAIGNESLESLTTQTNIIGIGHQAAKLYNGTGGPCLAIGIQAAQSAVSFGDFFAIGTSALRNLNASESSYNTAVGHGASQQTTTGIKNTTLGYQAGNKTTTGVNNLIIGYNADVSANNANNEIAIGSSAVGHGSNIAVIGNTDITAWHPADDNGVDLGSATYSFKDAFVQGRYYDTSGDAGAAGQVLSSTVTGTNWIAQTAATTLNGLTDVLVQGDSYYIGTIPGGLSGAPNSNTTIGVAGAALTTGDRNILVGNDAGKLLTTGISNVAIGATALTSQVAGNTNTAIGNAALTNQISGSGNTAVGNEAGDAITTGDANTLIGGGTGGSLTTGIRNTFIGGNSGGTVVSGNSNIHLGYSLNASGAAATNEIVIGTGMTGLGNNTVSLGTAATTLISGRNNGNMDLGSSSAKFKDVYLNTGRILTGDMSAPPASAGANGTIGDILFTTTHIYVCIATDTWRRVAIATWV